MNNAITSWVRTIVPTIWSAVVAWAVTLGLPEQFSDELNGLAGTLIVPLVMAGVYAALRWAEGKLPDWATVVLLGSARTPEYVNRDRFAENNPFIAPRKE